MDDNIIAPKPASTTSNDINLKITESETYDLLLEKDEIQLTMSLYDNSYIEFKLVPNNIIASNYYIAKYNLETINKKSYIFCKDLKEVFQFYNKILQKKKIDLLLSKDKSKINMNFKNIINFDEQVETNLELNEVKLSKEEILQILIKEVFQSKKQILLLEKKVIENEQKYNAKIKDLKIDYEQKIEEIKKNNNLLLEEYNKRKQKEKEEEENRKKEEEKIALNDNVNLINNFKFENIDKIKNINVISNDLNITFMKSVAVYTIIKNNESLYEIAYPDNKNGYNIIIYNLLLNKIENKINNAHSNNIHKIKHYFNPSTKNHILLSSSADQSIKLWNISSNPIINILTINNCFDGDSFSPFCLMFKEEDFFIFGGSRDQKKKIWNQNGILIGNIEKSNLNYGRFIETVYIENKAYILLSGQYHSECLYYDDNIIKIYKNNNNSLEHNIINLFNKNKNIYLITGCMSGKVNIFDFMTTNFIKEIGLENSNIYSLCSINEKYIIASCNKSLKVIDIDSYSIVKEYSGHNNEIYGMEKIKIPEKGEYLISYDSQTIKIWK